MGAAYSDDAFTLTPTLGSLTQEAWGMIKGVFGYDTSYSVSEDEVKTYNCTTDPRDGLRYTPETQSKAEDSSQWVSNPMLTTK